LEWRPSSSNNLWTSDLQYLNDTNLPFTVGPILMINGANSIADASLNFDNTLHPHLRLGGEVTTVFTVGGSISGLNGSVTLQNNGGDDLDVNANGSFAFVTALADSDGYSVTVLTQPAGQTCSVTNGAGTVSGAAVTDVAVDCVDDPVVPPEPPAPPAPPEVIPTMSAYGLVLTMLGLLVVATRRLRASAKRD
jgi:hypothetical protein